MLFFTFVLPVLFVIYCYIRILRTLNEATFNSFHLNAGSSIVRKHTSSSHTNSTLLNALTEENLPSTINNSNSNTAGNNSDLNARDSFTRSSLRSQRAHKTVMKMLSEFVFFPLKLKLGNESVPLISMYYSSTGTFSYKFKSD
ncbi:unnamed protein product [Meloidogyne enterolobii]|uniref:Uncharacterized protein n=1 Tax=Meloidogyne enterolobii TaxID=390850 RepID=A0ACB0YF41_MELEN